MRRNRGAASASEIFVCGRRAVDAVLRAGTARRIWIDARGGDSQSFARRTQSCGAHIAFASAAEISALLGHSAHQGIAAAAAPPLAKWENLLAAKSAPIIALDGVTDPRNLGAIIRVARAFNAAGVVAPRRRAAPLSAAAAKSSAGAAAFMPLHRAANMRRALCELRAAGRRIIGASEKADIDAAAADLPPAACWVFGDESGGLRRLTAESCDMLVRLPTAAGESGCLNVAAACAACLAIAAARNRLPE